MAIGFLVVRLEHRHSAGNRAAVRQRVEGRRGHDQNTVQGGGIHARHGKEGLREHAEPERHAGNAVGAERRDQGDGDESGEVRVQVDRHDGFLQRLEARGGGSHISESVDAACHDHKRNDLHGTAADDVLELDLLDAHVPVQDNNFQNADPHSEADGISAGKLEHVQEHTRQDQDGSERQEAFPHCGNLHVAITALAGGVDAGHRLARLHEVLTAGAGTAYDEGKIDGGHDKTDDNTNDAHHGRGIYCGAQESRGDDVR